MSQKKNSGLPRWAWALIIVAVIVPIGLVGLSIVAAIAIPGLMTARIEADQAQAEADIRSIAAAVENYVAIEGTYPRNIGLLTQPDESGAKYLNQAQVPADPWGRPYILAEPGVEAPFAVVYTLGADGLPGGEFFDADISIAVSE